MAIIIRLRRIDGIIQRYHVKRRKPYSKLHYSKERRANIWVRKEIVMKTKVIRKVKPQKMWKQIWHIKYVYDSERGIHHDLLIEVRATTIRLKPLTEQEVKELADDSTEVRMVVENADMPFVYTKIVVGLETEEEVEANAETTDWQIIRFGRDIKA